MNHQTFVEKYNKQELSVNIDRDKAGFMYEKTNLMPQELRKKQAMIRFFAFFGLISSIVLFFYIQWWIALILFFVSFSIFPQIQKMAMKDVLDISLVNSDVYQAAIDNQVLIINSKMTKDEISNVQEKGLKLLEDIEEELKNQEIGTTTNSKTFEGEYSHYNKFFKKLKNFRDLDNNSCLFTLNTVDTTIGVTIINIESTNFINISAEKLS